MENNRTNKASRSDKKTSGIAHTKGKDGSLNTAIHEALDQVMRDQSISFSPIDTWAYMLAIPSTFKYTLDETRQIAKEIQHTILPPKKPRAMFHIVTWPEVSNKHFNINPTFKTWYKGKGNPFEDGTQYVFFLDTDLLKKTLLNGFSGTLFQALNHNDLAHFTVTDGRFEISVPVVDLATHSLWTAKNFSEVAEEWTTALEPNFRLIQALYLALKATYPNAKFRSEERQIIMDSTLGTCALDYNKMRESIQFFDMRPADWLKQLSLTDLMTYSSRATISLRSKTYAKARPECLHLKEEGYVLSAEKEISGRLTSIVLEEKTNVQRFKHYLHEDKRQLPHKSFSGHSFCQDLGSSFTMGIVGDQVASILLHPELILGALQTSFNRTPSVRVVAASEDNIVIAHSNTPWVNIEEALRRGNSLLLGLSPDGSDPVYMDEHILLPEHACGTFDFLPVPNSYFDLIETAADESLALPPGRGFYLRGLAFELIRQWSLAEQEFRRAFFLDSSDGDVSHALGRALGENGKHKEALQFLKKAALALPEDAEIANTYGLALLKCSHIDQASKLFERAVNLAPDDPQFLSNLGQSYFMSQRLSDAENILGKALEYAPSFSDAHSTLAQIRWRQGDISSARKHARKAFAANPGNKGVQDLLWALTVDENK